MKPTALLRRFLAIAGSAALTASYTHAATLYWDGNSTDGNANGGAGTWINGTTLNWDTLPFGGTDSVWTNGAHTAVFGGTAGTATIGTGGVTVGGLTFNTTGYTVAAGANGLTFSSGTNNVWLSAGLNGSPSATITGTVAGSGANLNFVANPGATASNLTFSGISAGGWDGTTTIGSGMTLTTTTTSGNINKVLNSTSGITLNGGAIQFNRATNAGLAAISDSAAITVNGGGTFGVTSADAGGASAIETIGAVTVNSGQMNFNWTNGASSGAQMILSGLTRNGTSAVTFSGNLGSTGRWKVNGKGTTTAGEIIGAWATTGAAGGIGAQNDYAVYSGDFVAAAGIAASAESAWSTTHAATSNYNLATTGLSGANGILSATRNVNTVRTTQSVTNLTSIASSVITVTGSSFTDGTAVQIGGTAPTGLSNNTVYYVVNASGATFRLATSSGGTPITITGAVSGNIASGITLSTGNNLGTYGILNGSTSLLAIGRSGTGVVTLPSAVSDNLHVTAGSAGIAINAPIANNGAGVLTLVKNGGSTLFLSGANTYSGGTVINAGNITVSAAAGWVASQNLTFGGTGSLSASVGALSGGTLTANQGATASITGTSGITFASTSGAGQIIYGGGSSATLNLGDASGFTGNVLLSIGIGGTNPRPTLRFSKMADTAGSYIGWGAASGEGDSNQRAQIELNDNGGALTFNNRQLVNLPRTASNGAAKSLILGNNNSTLANKWVINTDFLNQGDRSGQGLIFEGSNAGDNAFNGVIGNSTLNGAAMNVYKTGTGKWILGGNNTFTGRLIAGQGTLSVGTLNEVGVAGPLGMNNNIQLGGDERTGVGGNSTEIRLVGTNSGTLEYTGAAVTSSRSFFIGDNAAANTGGGTIANNGSGAITFSAATFNPTQTGITATRTLTLGGSYTGAANEVEGIIQDNVASTGKVALTKTGDSKWVLGGDNTYTGATAINQGSLIINGNSSTAVGAVTVAAAGTIGGIGTVGGATTLNGTLSSGESPGTLTFANNLTVNNGSTYLFESGDLTNVNGTLDLNDNWTLTLSGLGFQNGGSVILFDYFALAATPDLVPTINLVGLGFTPSGGLTLTDNGSAIVLNGISAIPEPNIASLIGALGGILLLRRRR